MRTSPFHKWCPSSMPVQNQTQQKQNSLMSLHIHYSSSSLRQPTLPQELGGQWKACSAACLVAPNRIKGDIVRWCSCLVYLTPMWFPFVWPGPYFPLRLIPHYSHHHPSATLICRQALGGEASIHRISDKHRPKGMFFNVREHTIKECLWISSRW